MSSIPERVADLDSWATLQRVDNYAENLSQWEANFIEGLTRQLLEGRHLTDRQRQRLRLIETDKVPGEGG